MIDINLIRTNPDLVKENIKKKFQDAKLPLVDEVLDLDKKNREAIQRADYLRSQRNSISKQIGQLMGKGQKEEAEAAKQQVKDMQDELAQLEVKEAEYAEEIKKRMMVIPNIIDASVPVGRDDSENVENERFGEPVVPAWEIPYHVDIMERLNGIDLICGWPEGEADIVKDDTWNGYQRLETAVHVTWKGGETETINYLFLFQPEQQYLLVLMAHPEDLDFARLEQAASAVQVLDTDFSYRRPAQNMNWSVLGFASG